MGLLIHSVELEKILNKTNSNPIQGNKSMKTTINSFLIALGLAAITTQSFAEVGIVETTAAVNNGTGTVYVSATGGGANPRWSGYNFGTFDLGLTPSRLEPSNVTQFHSARHTPKNVSLDRRVQPPIFSGKPERKRILSPSYQPPSLE